MDYRNYEDGARSDKLWFALVFLMFILGIVWLTAA